jgi:prenyltransferase beta subunit
MKRTALALGLLMVGLASARANEPASPLEAAREKGLQWLTEHQTADGSWGKTHTIAVTSFVCLSYLSAADEPFTGKRGQALEKGIQFLLQKQKDGLFADQGHGWIFGQGFATLALSEAYGRSLLCKSKPDLDLKKIRGVVAQAVGVIGENQSTSGGWWYTPGRPDRHEGATTVCAVQALVSADNYNIPIDRKVLDRGFEYLKQCQNEDGGFDYQLGDTRSMNEGTAAAVATLGLMKKFDYTVMIKGYQFLLKIKPATITAARYPYYGHFYGCLGMHLLGQEYQEDRGFRENTREYIAEVQRQLVAWQEPNGACPLRGWMPSSLEDADYPTAFATMTLFVTEGRLSVYNRKPSRLPG